MIIRRHFLRTACLFMVGILTTSFRKLNPLIRTSAPLKVNTILGRPTRTSIALNLISETAGEMLIAYGTDKAKLSLLSPTFSPVPGNPIEFELQDLKPFTRYYYQMRESGQSTTEAIRTFQTNRKPDDTFVFTVTADSHLGTPRHCNPHQYRQTLRNALNDIPDFHISLGDDFRSSKVKSPSSDSIAQLYRNQREFLGELCHSAPFFFVLGNHELENKGEYDGTDHCIASWSYKARQTYLALPAPVNSNRQNYYSFVWGNALFIILDTYWYSGGSSDDSKVIHDNEWDFTLGKEQYDWFRNTLETSSEKYKFVFGHHVLGSCRGGVEWTDKYEWGGHSKNGQYEFDLKRPGWNAPVHQTMVKYGVNAFFQGHDHIFIKNEKDGVSYITCPMPGDEFSYPYNIEAYLTGDKIENAGHLKVTVTREDVQLEYIKSVQGGKETDQLKNGDAVYHCSLITKKKFH